MARFHFKMDSLLKLRENLEEQKKNEFGKAAQELERQRQKLRKLNSSKQRSIQEFQENIKKRIDSQKNDTFNKYLILLNKQIEGQIIQVQQCEAMLEEKRLELIEATKEKKKLEKLKEKQFEEYIIEEKHSEQKITDEVVSYQTYSKGV